MLEGAAFPRFGANSADSGQPPAPPHEEFHADLMKEGSIAEGVDVASAAGQNRSLKYDSVAEFADQWRPLPDSNQHFRFRKLDLSPSKRSTCCSIRYRLPSSSIMGPLTKVFFQHIEQFADDLDFL